MLILMKWNNGTTWSQLDYIPETGYRYHTRGNNNTKPAANEWIIDAAPVITGTLTSVGGASPPSTYSLKRSGNVVTFSGRFAGLTAGSLSGNSKTWQLPADMRPSEAVYGQWSALNYGDTAPATLLSGPFVVGTDGIIIWRGAGNNSLTFPIVTSGFSVSIAFIVD